MDKLILIAGPCVIESEEAAIQTAETIKGIAHRLGLDYYFKASFDKANRTSMDSYRGPGIEDGLEILKKVKDVCGVKICTDIHEAWQAQRTAEVADIIQIPAFLCRQTDLLVAAAKTGKIINVKKAQFLAPWDMKNVIKKIEDAGNRNIMLCERGTSFGYNRLVVDMTGICEMKKLGYPVVMDATHSIQKPGGKGTMSGGNRAYAEPLAKAAAAAGADAFFFEVHPDPDNALSDGPNMIKLAEFEEILKRVVRIYDAASAQPEPLIHEESSMEGSSCSYTDSIAQARCVFDTEIDALKKTRNALDGVFVQMLHEIVNCQGKVIVTGMGKPGHIATKLAATFASLGTPSFCMHPADAMHGDLGMISRDDIVIVMSYSGESSEITSILPGIKMIGARIMALTGSAGSTLAKMADIVQVFPAFKEACHLGLAPTSSTTAELVYGDALAIAASRIYGFEDADFGKFHPAGSLGKRAATKVGDLMAKGEMNPVVRKGCSVKEAIVVLSRCGMGMVSVIDDDGSVAGIITNGDLRRTLEKGADIYSLKADDIMTREPIFVSSEELAINALGTMKKKNITCFPVLEGRRLAGVIKMQDILQAGIINTGK